MSTFYADALASRHSRELLRNKVAAKNNESAAGEEKVLHEWTCQSDFLGKCSLDIFFKCTYFVKRNSHDILSLITSNVAYKICYRKYYREIFRNSTHLRKIAYESIVRYTNNH